MYTVDSRNKREIQEAAKVRIVSNFEMWQKEKKKIADGDKPYPLDSFPGTSTAVDGVVPGELVIVSGMPGSGKSTLCRTITSDLCMKNERPLWFSYEMPPRYFLSSFPVNAEPLQFYMPLTLKPNSIIWLEEIAKRAVDEKACNFMFIDHLHYIYDMSRTGNVALELGHIVRRLKRLAVETEMVVFLICHTSKIQKGDMLGIYSLRDSALVACEADTVIFTAREIKEEGGIQQESAYLQVSKARRTGVMFWKEPIVKEGYFLREL